MRLASLLFSTLILAAGPASAQDDIEALYRTALINSPTPVTLRLDQAAWRTERAEATGEDRIYADDYRREALTETIRRDAILSGARIAPGDLGSTCVDSGLSECVTGPAGSILTAAGDAVYYQIQTGSTDLNGMSSAVVLLVSDGTDLTPLAWAYGGAYYENPEVHQPENGPIYLGLSGYSQGTGSFNLNALFRWNGENSPLTEIDGVSWQEGLAARLPRGLEVWKGLDFNWSQMTAASALWREGDANCCPSGGEVGMSFEVKDDQLSLIDLYTTDRILSVAAEIEPNLLAWLARKEQCDAARAVQEPGVEPVQPPEGLACATVAADGASLRAANADQPGNLALMDRAAAD